MGIKKINQKKKNVWQIAIDFSKIKKGGVRIDKILEKLK